MKTTPIGPYLGINNRLPDFDLRLNTRQISGNYLRRAENVDIDNSGNLRRRESELLVQALTDAHSLHLTSATAGYLVRDSVLYAITLPTYAESFAKLLTSNDPVSWLPIGDDLYFSNGTDSGRITQGLFFPLGLPTPDAPACNAVGGSLTAGTYQVAVSYYNSVTGEEGGISASSNPVIAGGLQVALPAETTGATHANVYVSAADGSVPMLARSVALGAATTTFTTPPTQGRESNGRDEDPLPAGTLFSSNGRLCSFSGSTVYVGLPFRPGYYLPAEGYIPFPAEVSIAIENQAGTFIAADKTYWVPGDLGAVEGALATVLPYGAVPGTAFSSPNKSEVGWFGVQGFVIGKTSGEVEAPMSDHIDQTPPASGVATIRTTKGYRRVLAAGWCMNLDRGATTQYVGFDFNSFAGEYGLKSDGLYALSGGTGVDAVIGLGKTDFGSEELKHLPAAYLGVDAPEPMVLVVSVPNGMNYSYTARSSGEDLQIQRIDPGRGLRANWYDLSVYNTEGSDFTLATVSFAPVASGRRI